MTKESQVIIGLSIGKSFAEISALNSNQEEVAFQRWYIPRESISAGISRFLSEIEEYEISQVLVSSQYLEKLFDFKLGGSVAQVVTLGFENWSYLKQPSLSPIWKKMERAPTLSIMDHWIPVSERISPDGVIERELSNGELDSTLDYIKAHDIKRICVHFINSSKNPHNQDKAVKYFTEAGYDVFYPQMFGNSDEVATFRENTLNASMTGTWEDMSAEIFKSLEGKVNLESIFFLNGNELFQNNKNYRWRSLWGFAFAQSKVIPQKISKNCDILHLGLEKFELINCGSQMKTSKTPWGDVNTLGPQTHRLSVQPDSSVELNNFKELDLSLELQSFEPGPMTMGRGLKPLVFDCFHEQFSSEDEIEGISSVLSSNGTQRFYNSLMALAKTSKNYRNEEVDEIIHHLRAIAAHKIINEVLWKMKTDQLVVTGYFSELIKDELKEVFKSIFNIRLTFIDSSDSDIVAQFGAQ